MFTTTGLQAWYWIYKWAVGNHSNATAVIDLWSGLHKECQYYCIIGPATAHTHIACMRTHGHTSIYIIVLIVLYLSSDDQCQLYRDMMMGHVTQCTYLTDLLLLAGTLCDRSFKAI